MLLHTKTRQYLEGVILQNARDVKNGPATPLLKYLALQTILFHCEEIGLPSDGASQYIRNWMNSFPDSVKHAAKQFPLTIEHTSHIPELSLN